VVLGLSGGVDSTVAVFASEQVEKINFVEMVLL
jgi:NH3-dependent NAD+ synthetase